MKGRPILFSGPMVRAILDGSKTQTRRVVKMPEGADGYFLTRMQEGYRDGTRPIFGDDSEPNAFSVRNRYGKIGDRLWVKETHWAWGKFLKNGKTKSGKQAWRFKSIAYRKDFKSDRPVRYVCADPFGEPLVKPKKNQVGFHKRPSIFMPRLASRITLEITGVMVERLQEISEEDAKAEGTRDEIAEPSEQQFDLSLCPRCGGTGLYDTGSESGAVFDVDCSICDTYRKRYKILWDSINGKKHPWASNPWVWCISFRRL